MVPRGITPNRTSIEANEAGFKLIIFPGLMLSAVYNSCNAANDELKSTGTAPVKVSERMKQERPKELFMLCGLAECLEFHKKAVAGGPAYSKAV